MKNKIIQHLTIRIGVPFIILFLIWKLGNLKNGSLEKSLLFSIFSSILILVAIIFVTKETIVFNKNNDVKLRNINIILLVVYIIFFLFMSFASFAIATF